MKRAPLRTLASLLLVGGCAPLPAGTLLVRASPAMTLTALRAAVGRCAVVTGFQLPPAGRPLRIEWSGGRLDAKLFCDTDARALVEDPRIHQVGLLHWEPDEGLFSISHPSGPGRAALEDPLPYQAGLMALFVSDNGPNRCRAVEATPAIRFLSAFARIAPGFERVAFPGLTREEAACPCSFGGVAESGAAETSTRPLDWVEIAAVRPLERAGDKWVLCGPVRKTVRIKLSNEWLAIGEYDEHYHDVIPLKGKRAMLYHRDVGAALYIEGRREPAVTVEQPYVSGDGARVGSLNCAGQDSLKCTTLHFREYDPRGQLARDWNIPVQTGEYYPEGYDSNGAFIVRFAVQYNQWRLGRLEPQTVVPLARLPDDAADWDAIRARYLSTSSSIPAE